MSMQELMNNFNADLMKEVNRPNVIETSTYVAHVVDFKTRIDEKTQVAYLNLTLDLYRDDEAKVGRTWLDITSADTRTLTGKLKKPSELFYKLAKVLGVKDGEEMVEKLPGAIFSVYGTETYMARNSEMPRAFQDVDQGPTSWIKVYVNEGDETKRDLLLDAEIKPRFEVQRVGQHRG